MNTAFHDNDHHCYSSVKYAARGIALAAVMSVLCAPVLAGHDDDDDDDGDGRGTAFCTKTAKAVLRACANEVRDDYWIAIGNCINVSDPMERYTCRAEAKAELAEGRESCGEQFDARLELCDLVGEERYEPDFDPALFDADLATPNPYFPLHVGNRWVYEGGDETITVEVLDKTKLIEEVTCRVVNDVVTENGDVIEDTDDWYAQRWDGVSDGEVWYCGEIAKNFESFEGDDPEEPELVDIEGSWKAGRDDAKPGIVMEADPQPGDAYRQEVALGNAEDAAEVLSNSYHFGVDPDLDQFVPAALADALCDHDCVVTREFTPIEPDAEERKYYAPGVGLFLEVNTETGDIVQLVECIVDSVPCPIPAP